MKKIGLLIAFATAMLFAKADEGSNFKFVKYRVENESVKVFFNLTNDVSIENLKENLSSIAGVKSISLSEQGYITLDLENQNNNDEIRKAIIILGSDFDDKFIRITGKSFYNK